LWSAVFDRAVGLQQWSDAFEALLRIEAFESHLRLLSQRLRSCGRLELMLTLPEPQRSCFLNNLYEHASMGTPVAGSDALSCYQHLYALHVSNKEYMKAAEIAYALHSALGSRLRRFSNDSSSEAVLPALLARSDLRTSTRLLQAGDCMSNISDVPAPKPASITNINEEPLDMLSPYARSLDHVWPLLEQQRSALLMLSSALSLTNEKLLKVPASIETQTALGEDCSEWFAQARRAPRASSLNVDDVRRWLSVVEAQLMLSGRDDMNSTSETAKAVASLGLLRLAVQVSQACGLDEWECAYQPFVKLCVDAETTPDDKVEALVNAARGPAQAYMFLNTDGAVPLGTGGCIRKAGLNMSPPA
jgi:hypothetical protein